MVSYYGLLLSFFLNFCLFSSVFSHEMPLLSELYGNKYAHLVRLKTIVEGEADVTIPEFIGISTDRIEAFLRHYEPSIFTSYWDYISYRDVLIELQDSRKKSFVGTFVDNILIHLGIRKKKKSVEECLLNIQSLIRIAFERHYFEFTEDEKAFFERIRAKDQCFMVRSSGIEDGQAVANAGGNVSVSYVHPTPPSIKTAMGMVVASYFSMQSLKNRLAGGEIVSADNLCLPVLIQTLIGESVNGGKGISEIPISGVAFTTNKSLGTDTFLVTEINAAYGHGEGVVTSRVVADRYYITRSRAQKGHISIYPMIFHKANRLVKLFYGEREEHLALIKNSIDCAYKSALSYDQIRRLYVLLKRIEDAYGQPMDVEFVILDTIIYIVQARPAIHSPKSPSYIAQERVAEGDIVEKIGAITLVSGSAQVLCITDPKDLILENTLDNADQMPNSAVCKAVIVGEWAAPLSHAAVNFMSHGIPCFYVSDLSVVKKMRAHVSLARPLVIDVQRRSLFLWHNTQKKVQDCVDQGWIEHPIDRTLSLYLDPMPKVKAPNSPMPQDAQLAKLLENLKNASTSQTQKEFLAAIVERVTRRLVLTERRIHHFGVKCFEPFHNAFTHFKATFNSLIAEFSASIEDNAEHFEFLFYHKMLEALIYQIDDSNAILGAYTYSYFLNDLFAQQAFHMAVRKLGNNSTFTQEYSYARECPSPELATQWRLFLTVLEEATQPPSNVTDISMFKALLIRFDEMGALPLWFATDFYQAMGAHSFCTMSALEKSSFTHMFLVQEVAHYTSHVRDFLDILEKMKEVIEDIAMQQNGAFTSVKAVQAVQEQITHGLIGPVTDPLFIAGFGKLPLVVQLIACTILRACIDAIDATIKKVKTSTALSWNERRTQFNIMLDDFNRVSKVLLQDIMPEKALEYHSEWSLGRYLHTVQEKYDQIIGIQSDESMLRRLICKVRGDTCAQFQRSPTFSVNAAVLGSGTAFERHLPETVEDLFMLIHQNALAAISGTYASCFKELPLDKHLFLPKILCRAISHFESEEYLTLQGYSCSAPKRIGIDYTATTITLFYNLPLRNHSATFQIMYDQITDQCTCAVQFLGQARRRWQQVALLASISKDLSGLELVGDVVLDTVAGIVSWRWVVKNEEALGVIAEYLAIMEMLSFENDITREMISPLYRGVGGENRELTLNKVLTRL